MREFDYSSAPRSAKLLASAFLLCALIGLGVAGLQSYVKTGLTAAGILSHYRGDEAAMAYPKRFPEMVEVTHAHVFTMPMLALALGTAFLASGAGERLKVATVVALFGGTALELGVPWLVRYGPAWTVHLFNLAGGLLGGGLVVSVGVPLYEMWWRRVPAGLERELEKRHTPGSAIGFTGSKPSRRA